MTTVSPDTLLELAWIAAARARGNGAQFPVWQRFQNQQFAEVLDAGFGSDAARCAEFSAVFFAWPQEVSAPHGHELEER